MAALILHCPLEVSWDLSVKTAPAKARQTIKLITHAIAADAGTISVLGVEKGRLIFMLLICGGTFGGMYFKDKLITLSDQIDSVTMPILFIAVFTVIIVCASILISIQLYKSKQK